MGRWRGTVGPHRVGGPERGVAYRVLLTTTDGGPAAHDDVIGAVRGETAERVRHCPVAVTGPREEATTGRRRVAADDVCAVRGTTTTEPKVQRLATDAGRGAPDSDRDARPRRRLIRWDDDKDDKDGPSRVGSRGTRSSPPPCGTEPADRRRRPESDARDVSADAAKTCRNRGTRSRRPPSRTA